jgi:ribosomal protein L7/L12
MRQTIMGIPGRKLRVYSRAMISLSYTADTPKNAVNGLQNLACAELNMVQNSSREIGMSKVGIIKMVTDLTGKPLNEAKKMVEEYMDTHAHLFETAKVITETRPYVQ